MIALLVGLLVVLPLAVLLLSPLFRRELAATGNIYVIHSGRPLPFEVNSISRHRLEQFLDCAQEAGIEFAPLREALQQRARAAVTVDDGYDDLLRWWPLLRDRGIAVTVFVPTDYIGRSNDWDNFLTAGKRRHLSAVEIESLAAEGVLFGSHGHSHRDLTSLSDDELLQELEGSKAILENLCHRPVEYLAYPFGKTDGRVIEAAIAAGYSRGFLSGPAGSQPLAQGRIPLTRLDNNLSFRSKLAPDLLSGAEYLKASVITAFSHLSPVAAHLKRRSRQTISQ